MPRNFNIPQYYFIPGTPDDDVIYGTSSDDWITGGEGQDHLYGLGGNDFVWGEAGADVLYGGSGNDALFGGAEDDRLHGGSGEDSLYGDEGNDTLVGGLGADLMDGGIGNDTVSYEFSTSSVAVSLDGWVPEPGDAAGDTFASIENLVGSAHDDFLGGDDNDNTLDGRGGDDYLSGHGGDDTLLGGNGDDHLHGDAGADVINGGTGNDTASYMTSGAGVHIDLSTMLLSGGDAEGDVLSGIENLQGSHFSDTLTGDAGNNKFRALGDTDFLTGKGGADTFSFPARPSQPSESLGRDAHRVMDFSQSDGDKIELVVKGHGPAMDLTFIGDTAFSGAAGQVRYSHAGANSWISTDTDGDAVADHQILCVGLIDFTANDFIL